MSREKKKEKAVGSRSLTVIRKLRGWVRDDTRKRKRQKAKGKKLKANTKPEKERDGSRKQVPQTVRSQTTRTVRDDTLKTKLTKTETRRTRKGE